MSRNSNGENVKVFVLVLLLVAVGVGAGIVWSFSTTFGLDMATGASVLGRHVLLALICAGSWWISREMGLFEMSSLWPIALAGLWVCWWPALDFHAAQAFPSFYNVEEATVWYSQWYTKLGGIVLLLGSGYGLKAALGRRY